MYSKVLLTGGSSIFRQIALRNNCMIRNLFVIGLSSVAHYHVAAASNVVHPVPSVSLSPAIKMSYSTAVTIPVVEYAEVKDLPNHPEKLLIDVRELNELKETGQIPTSINIPLGIIDKELTIGAEEFKKKYGRAKPGKDNYVILSCRSGRRSQQAAEIAVALGYKNIHNYSGSWLDWADHEGLPK